MMRSFKTSYGAGYRAGMCGASYLANPHRNLIRRILWDNGWHKGMTVQLNYHLAKKGFFTMAIRYAIRSRLTGQDMEVHSTRKQAHDALYLNYHGHPNLYVVPVGNAGQSLMP